MVKDEVLDFSSNLNPFAPFPELVDFLNSVSSKMYTKHPPPYPEDLEEKLAGVLGLEREQVSLLPGSIYGIHAVFNIFDAKRAVVPVPTFNEYERVCSLNNVPVVYHRLVPENGFRLCLGELASKIDEGDIVFVCNPNNPTGYFFGVDEVAGLVRWCERKGAFVLFDEAFIDFTGHARETAQVILSSDNAVIVRSFTKLFSVPGIRVGYALGSPYVISRLREQVPSWSIDNVACEAVKLMVSHFDLVPQWRQKINEIKQSMIEELKKIGLSPVPSSANFLLVGTENRNALELGKELLKKGICVRTFPEREEAFAKGFFRIALRKEEENRRLLEALRELV